MTDNGASESIGPVSRNRHRLLKGAQALRLGAERPRITRLSRKVLAGGTALALLLISGAVLWALQEQPSAQSGTGRTLQHGSSQCRRWPDDVAAGLRRDCPRHPTDSGRHCRATCGIPPVQRKANPRRSALMPNNSVPTRKPRRLGPARYLRRQLRPLRHRMPHPRKRRPTTAPSSDETFTQNGQDQQTAVRQCPRRSADHGA